MIDPRKLAVTILGVCSIASLGCRTLGQPDVAQEFTSANTPVALQDDSGDEVRFQSPDLIQYQPEFEIPSAPVLETAQYPIDFPTVLRLAGADNWSIKIAQQRVKEASAEYCAVKHAWMPSMTVSAGFNKHEGQIQATEGDVVQVSRNSLFLGSGSGIANSPLNGGSGGPPRMFVDFSLADAIFKPLAARRLLGSERAHRNRVFNDTMLQASLAYYDLVRSQSQVSISQTNLTEAEELQRLTVAFIEGGKGTAADASRVRVIVNNRRMDLANAQAEVKIASAKLATVLQLDPTKLDPQQGLVALDGEPVPVQLIDCDLDLNSMIQQAQSLRCEIAEANATTYAANSAYLAEQWRPWLPNLYAGYSGGLFGGGQGGNLSDFDSRSDLDVVVSWQVKNMGFGSRARQDASRSRVYQRKYEMQQIRDQIAEQVTTTYHRVLQYQTTLGLLGDSVTEAGNGLEKNLNAIKGLEGLPLEAISSLEQLATARTEYLSAVMSYNQWQIRLLRAAGQSLAADAELGTIANCNAYSNGCDGCEPDCPSCVLKPNKSLKCSTGGCNSKSARTCRRTGRSAGRCDRGCECQSVATTCVAKAKPTVVPTIARRSGLLDPAATSATRGATFLLDRLRAEQAHANLAGTQVAPQSVAVETSVTESGGVLRSVLDKDDVEIGTPYINLGATQDNKRLQFAPKHHTAWYEGSGERKNPLR